MHVIPSVSRCVIYNNTHLQRVVAIKHLSQKVLHQNFGKNSSAITSKNLFLLKKFKI